MTSSLGLYSLLANANENLKGGAGASAVSSINEGITNGDNKMDLLLGWGTQYKGVAGRWALEQAKEQGISNPENLKNVFQNFERFTGQSIDSDSAYPSLHCFLKYATATSTSINSMLFDTQSNFFKNIVYSLEDTFSDNTRRISEKEYADFQQYILSGVYNNTPAMRLAIKPMFDENYFIPFIEHFK